MKVPAIDAYTNPITTWESAPVNSGNNVTENRQIEQRKEDQASFESLNSPVNLLSKKERDFFVKIFPDNSNQIENHVLFNRNGRLKTVNIMKGSIIDGRV